MCCSALSVAAFLCAACQARSRVNQLLKLGHVVDKVEFILMGGTFMSLPPDYRDYFVRNLHDALSGESGGAPEQPSLEGIRVTCKARLSHYDGPPPNAIGHPVHTEYRPRSWGVVCSLGSMYHTSFCGTLARPAAWCVAALERSQPTFLTERKRETPLIWIRIRMTATCRQ